jgi:hypothetical protein
MQVAGVSQPGAAPTVGGAPSPGGAGVEGAPSGAGTPSGVSGFPNGGAPSGTPSQVNTPQAYLPAYSCMADAGGRAGVGSPGVSVSQPHDPDLNSAVRC